MDWVDEQNCASTIVGEYALRELDEGDASVPTLHPHHPRPYELNRFPYELKAVPRWRQ